MPKMEKREAKTHQNFVQKRNPLVKIDREKNASIIACK